MCKAIFNHTGACIANHKIDCADLKVNQEYSLSVVVNVDGLELKNIQTFGKYIAVILMQYRIAVY